MIPLLKQNSGGFNMRSKMLRLVLSLTTLSVISLSANASVQESVPGEYVVKFKAHPAAMQLMSSKIQLGQSLHAFIKNRISSANIVVVQRASVETAESAISSLQENELVEYAEPNYIYHISKTPAQAGYINLWGLHNVGQTDKDGKVGVAGVDIDVEKAWDITTGSKQVLVAVIDTGIDYTHPDLVQNVWTNPGETGADSQGRDKSNNGVDDDQNGYVDDVHGFNFVNAAAPTNNPMDDHGHGSHCSGTIGGFGQNGTGIVGVNWNVKIVASKFLDANGGGTLEGAIMAIDYATKVGAKVMSNSWGGGGFSQALQDAVARATQSGAVFVAAAGNDGTNNDVSPAYPASFPVENIISVAAIDNQGNLASFSNMGARTVHLGAPGVNVYSSVKGGGYDTWSGTSMATPHVSGVAALLLAKEPNLTNAQVKQRLISTTRALPSLSGQTVSGGLINAYNALTNNTLESQTH